MLGQDYSLFVHWTGYCLILNIPPTGFLPHSPGDSALDKTGPFHNHQQNMLLEKCQPTIRARLMSTMNRILVSAEGRKGMITSAASLEGEQPVWKGLLSGTSESALGVVELVSQGVLSSVWRVAWSLSYYSSQEEKPALLFPHWYFRLREPGVEAAWQGAGSHCCCFWDILRRTNLTSCSGHAGLCECIEESWEGESVLI